MKNLINRALFDKNAKISLLFVIGVLLLVGLGCSGGKSKDAKPVSSDYYGAWTGDDGSTITIRGDGTGDYKSGGTSVNGGTVEINDADKTLSITFFGIGPTLKIDKAPSGNQMTLGGVVYKKAGSPDSKPDTKSSTKSGDAPSNSEVEALVRSSFEDFSDAVENEDFSDFYEKSSGDFQASYTKEQIKSTFAVFIDKKDQTLPSLRDVQTKSASFSSKPSVSTEKGIKVLVADGEFPSKPNATKFETKYEWEKGEWKILRFKVKM